MVVYVQCGRCGRVGTRDESERFRVQHCRACGKEGGRAVRLKVIKPAEYDRLQNWLGAQGGA